MCWPKHNMSFVLTLIFFFSYFALVCLFRSFSLVLCLCFCVLCVLCVFTPPLSCLQLAPWVSTIPLIWFHPACPHPSLCCTWVLDSQPSLLWLYFYMNTGVWHSSHYLSVKALLIATCRARYSDAGRFNKISTWLLIWLWCQYLHIFPSTLFKHLCTKGNSMSKSCFSNTCTLISSHDRNIFCKHLEVSVNLCWTLSVSFDNFAI